MGICLPDLGTISQGGSKHIERYLRKHGPSIAIDIAGEDYNPVTINKCLLARQDIFERTDVKRGRRVEWRLKMGMTLPDLPGTGGFKEKGKSPTRNHIIAYLDENGASTAAQIAGDTHGPANISLCLRTNPDLFERVGVTGNQNAVVWRLKGDDN